MKSLRWTVTPLLLAASLSMTAQRHTLSAKISGLGKNVTAYLRDVDNPPQTERLDSAKVGSDGSFSLALDLRKPRMCKLSFWLSDKASGKRRNLTTMMLLLDGCADVSLSGDTVRLFGRNPLVAMRMTGAARPSRDGSTTIAISTNSKPSRTVSLMPRPMLISPTMATRANTQTWRWPRSVRPRASTPW